MVKLTFIVLDGFCLHLIDRKILRIAIGPSMPWLVRLECALSLQEELMEGFGRSVTHQTFRHGFEPTLAPGLISSLRWHRSSRSCLEKLWHYPPGYRCRCWFVPFHHNPSYIIDRLWVWVKTIASKTCSIASLYVTGAIFVSLVRGLEDWSEASKQIGNRLPAKAWEPQA